MVLSLCALMTASPSAQAAPPKAKEAEPARTRWDLSLFTEIRLVPREAGAPPNAHPLSLEPAQLGLMLSRVRVKSEEGFENLFDPTELGALLKPLTEALATATPGVDLLLVSSHRRGSGLMGAPLSLAARLFVKDGALQLILGDTRVDATSYYLAQRQDPEFRFGTRAKASAAKLSVEGGAQPRADWVSLPFSGPGAEAPASPKSTPAPPVAAPKDARERLQNLKRLREENLISEAEYQAKRAEILKEL